MQPRTETKIVLVIRPSRLAELVGRFNTVAQARFYVEHLGADFTDYEREDARYGEALRQAKQRIAEWGRIQVLERRFLPNFIFGPQDVIVALGQDGLVANTLKYLDGQPLIGVNPDPQRWDGQLLPFRVEDLTALMPEVLAGRRSTRAVTLAQARLNNGQSLCAVNDLFVGLRTHGSARYRIRMGDAAEDHSSSGVIVSTGLGSTGWLQSLLGGATAISRSAQAAFYGLSMSAGAGTTAPEPAPLAQAEARARWQFPWDADYLYFTVREPFPSRRTGCALVFGRITADTSFSLESQMPENGVIFSDGIEHDFLEFNSGARAAIGLASRKGLLVV